MERRMNLFWRPSLRTYGGSHRWLRDRYPLRLCAPRSVRVASRASGPPDQNWSLSNQMADRPWPAADFCNEICQKRKLSVTPEAPLCEGLQRTVHCRPAISDYFPSPAAVFETG